MRKHADNHSVLDVYNALDSRIGVKFAGITEGIGKTLADVAKMLSERIDNIERKLSEKGAGEQPKQVPQEPPLLVGEDAREADIRAAAARSIAEGLAARGWSADDISKIMAGIGQVLGGIGPLIQALKPTQYRPSPFEDAGRAMFTAFAEAMTKGVARTLGKKVGEEVITPEGGEHE